MRRSPVEVETHDAAEHPSPMVALPGLSRRRPRQHRSPPEVHNPFAGPLSRDMWEKAHAIPSQYRDTFDYGIYDRLVERFDDHQPRGGVIYKGTMKLLQAQDCAQCFDRFEIDTYGRGCRVSKKSPITLL